MSEEVEETCYNKLNLYDIHDSYTWSIQNNNIAYFVLRQNTLQRSDSSRELNSEDLPTFVQPETNKFDQ